MRSHITRVRNLCSRKSYPFNALVSAVVPVGQKYQQSKYQANKLYYGAAIVSTLSFALGFAELQKNETKKKLKAEQFGVFDPTLPNFTKKEVAKHNNKKTGVWVTYRHGVYDITKYVDFHPGGDAIWIAAGSAIDPFWKLYEIHKTLEIQQLLEQYRIGNLLLEQHSPSDDTHLVNPFESDPQRSDLLKPASTQPYNAEPPSDLLIEKYITPKEIFFVRNHLPVPDVDPDLYELEVEGVGIEAKTFSLKELQGMAKSTVVATIMCAGNRRNEMSQVKTVKGLGWGNAAIGNAEWTGVKLCDFLKNVGVTEDTKALHVQFEGLDFDLTNTSYGASIPLVTALDPNADVLLAYEMNGEPLSRDHGYPIRVVVPGVVGARNVKWLSKIVVSTEESESHWQRSDYKGFSPNVDWDNVDFSKSPAIQELPVISAICVPSDGDSLKVDSNNTIDVKGYAWSGGGRGIVRVDLTCDGGSNWHTASLCPKEKTCNEKPGCRVWDWTVWEAKLPLPNEKVEMVEIWVKAVDSSYNTQPESFENIWNLRGVLNNAYHRVSVKLNRQ